MKPASLQFATTQLRSLDRDRYFSTLVLGAKERGALTALCAFNADVASIRERVREPAAGEIRLQWWIDALSGEGHGAVRDNPLADALLDTIVEFGLPVSALVRLLEARRFDLYQDPMPDLASFEGYAGETVSVLYQLGGMILNGGKTVETGDAAGHLGVAHALTGHLRAFGYNASQGRIFLPWSVFVANGVGERDVLTGQGSEGLVEALRQVAETANDHLAKADTAIRGLPRPVRAGFASAAMVRQQLRSIDISRPFARQGDLADWRKIAALMWWMFRRG